MIVQADTNETAITPAASSNKQRLTTMTERNRSRKRKGGGGRGGAGKKNRNQIFKMT